MPMQTLPYGKGPYLNVVERVLNELRAESKVNLAGAQDVGALANQRANSNSPHQLDGADNAHFQNDWLTASGGGCPAFDQIPPDRIRAVLKEGFRVAVTLAQRGLEELPIYVAWIHCGDPHVFDVVTIVNDKAVQVLIVTPVPLIHPISGASGTAANSIYVTRHFATQDDINHVEHRLQLENAPADKQMPKNAKNQAVTPTEVGTFEIHTWRP